MALSYCSVDEVIIVATSLFDKTVSDGQSNYRRLEFCIGAEAGTVKSRGKTA